MNFFLPVRLIILTYCFCKRWTKVLDFVKKFGRTYLALDLTPNQNCQTFSKWYFKINFSLHFQSQLNISFPFKFWDIFRLYQTSKMKLCEKILNGLQPLTIFAKSSVFDVWQGSEYRLELSNASKMLWKSPAGFLNPSTVNVSILPHLKTPMVFWCFHGKWNRNIGQK